MKKYFYRPEGVARGITLLELLVVIAIIGILVLISLPNIVAIIASHRTRSSANDMLTKTRSIRSLAISKRRELKMIVDTTEHTFRVEKPAHTEYDLLKDISGTILASPDEYPNLTSLILYEENALLLEQDIHIGDAKNDGYDNMTTTCQNDTVTFNPSGTIEPTCAFTIKDTRYNREYTLKLYKGGQIMLK